MNRRGFLPVLLQAAGIATLLCATLWPIAPVHAADYPSGPVKFIVPFPASSEITPGTPRELGEFVLRGIDKWKRVVAQAKLELE